MGACSAAAAAASRPPGPRLTGSRPHRNPHFVIGTMPRTDAALSVTIRDRLRNASAASHAAVDARFAPLLDGGEARYSEFLVASAAGVIPLETSLEAAGVAIYLPDWAARSRASALRADLRDFGRAPAEGERVPALRGEAMVYGALYVLEGSRLGARVL